MKHKAKHKSKTKRLLFLFIYGLSCAFLILVVIELVYRFQIIDTYKQELRSFNVIRDLAGRRNRKTILVMGDSMTAGNESYPSLMRDKLPGYRIINSGISGTCIIETALIAPKRFKEFNPSIFIYQVYVGNDLFEIRHPVNWKTVPFLRNVYWFLSNRFRSLCYLNYRLKQKFVSFHKIISGSTNSRSHEEREIDTDIDRSNTFSVQKYTRRIRITLQAESGLLQNQILVQNGRQKDFGIFLKKLQKVISYCKDAECQAYVLIIPQCCQVSSRYLRNMELLGAKFDRSAEILQDEYPFIIETRRALANIPNVTVLNPIQALKDREVKGDKIYFENDEHLTPMGQAVIAEFILTRLNLK